MAYFRLNKINVSKLDIFNQFLKGSSLGSVLLRGALRVSVPGQIEGRNT